MKNTVNPVRKFVGNFRPLSNRFRGFPAFTTIQGSLLSNGVETFRLACGCRHEPSRVLLIFCLLLAINAALPSTSLAAIKVEPGTTVQVGEEVFFSGCDINIPGAQLLSNGMINGTYEWDFGDNSPLMSENFYEGGGTLASHYYMRPGTYTVTLKVTDKNGKSKTDTITITVEGEDPKLPPGHSPDMILELKFDGNLDVITSGSGLTAQWQGTGSFVRGIEGQAVDLTNGSYIEISDPTGILSGVDELTISVWAKKKNASATGYLLGKNGAYNVVVWDGWPASVAGHIYTESGSARPNNRVAHIADMMWHHYVITYNGSLARLFVDGEELIENLHAPLPLTGKVKASIDNLLIGKKLGATDPYIGEVDEIFNGYIDEVKIYNKALTPKEISTGFELWHANFHGRIAQYIYAQIPEGITKDSTNKIKATIAGDTGFFKILLDKNNLQLEEKFLLNNAELPAGNYALTVQLLDAGNNILDELIEKFEKPYDDIPVVGIDENNAIRINGELFFPVTSWILVIDFFNDWKAGKYINTLESQGWQPAGKDWKDYLDEGDSRGWYGIGSGRWTDKNIDPNGEITSTINLGKEHTRQLMWLLNDEPALAGVPSVVLRGQTYKCHKLDSQHPVIVNYALLWASEGFWESNIKKYDYLYNAKHFGGKKTHPTDVMSMDNYPVEVSAKTVDSVEKLALGLDRLIEGNYNLVPYMSFVETCNLKELDLGQDRNLWYDKNGYSVSNAAQTVVTKQDAFKDYPYREGHLLYISVTGDNNHAKVGTYTIMGKLNDDSIILDSNATDGIGNDINVTLTIVGTPQPTPEQLRMLIWLNVVHGAKGIEWFPFFMPTPPENFGVMTEFLDHITRLTPVVLGPETDRTVTDSADEMGSRVDTMIRDDGEDIWLIAARVTEVKEPQDNDDLSVTFTVNGLTSGMSVIELGEFSQSIEESYGHPTERKRIFSFSLDNTPIIPGTVHVAGQYTPGESARRIYLYDDGNGNLYGNEVSWMYKDMYGTVDYTTGEVYVDFGDACIDIPNNIWTDKPILPGKDVVGKDMVRVTYRPVKGDRIIPHTGNTITDTFAPNAVHIYRIGASSSGNHPPVLQEIGNKSVNENSALIFDVNATDADGDTITYSATGTAIDAGATFSGQTFSWTPSYDQADTYPVTFIASDGTTSDSETITITVKNVNRPPNISAIPTSLTKDESETITPSKIELATDLDGENLIYTYSNWLTSLPYLITYDDASGSPYTLHVDVTDSNDTVGKDITIIVNNVNRAPVLNPIDDISVYVNDSLDFTVSAIDPDGSAITYSASDIPTGANFDPSTKRFTWTPDGSQVGGHEVTFIASDGQLQDTDRVIITVNATDNTAPSVTKLSPDPNDFMSDSVPLNSLILLDITDTGKGVDRNTVEIRINNDLIYDGDNETSVGVYDSTGHVQTIKGICRRIGSSTAYKYIFQPDEKFDYDQELSTAVNAADLATPPNTMSEYQYSLISKMRSFGENKILSSGSSNDNWGPLTTVSDSSGNIWVAWPQGVVGSRDIYVGKLVAGTDSFVSSGVVQVTNDIPDQGNPVIAVDSSDKLYLAWQDNRYGEWDIFVSTSTDGINWTAEKLITDPNYNQTNPAMAIDSSDEVYIVYDDDQNTDKDIYRASSADNYVSKIQITSAGTGAVYDQTTPDIAVDSDDTVYVVWADARNWNGDGKIKYDMYGAASDNSWTNIEIVDKDKDGQQTAPKIATEDTGTILHFVWVDDTPGDDDIYYASTSDGLPSSPLTGRSIIDDPCEKDQLSPVIITTGYTGNDLKVFACWRDERWADVDLFFDELSSGDVNNVFVGDDGTSTDQSEPAIGIDEYGHPYLVWINERTDICYAGSTFIEPVVLASSTVSVSSKTTVGTVPGYITNIDDVSAEVPQGAYLCDVEVTISRIRNPHKPPSNNRTFLYEFGPSGTTFSKPVTITIPYNATTLVSSPSAYWYNPLTGLYSQEGITDVEVIQTPSGLYALRFKTTHFSIFGGGGPFDDIFGGGGGGGGCSMSPNSQDSIAELLLPYIGLAVTMVLLKLRDRRKRKAHNITKSGC